MKRKRTTQSAFLNPRVLVSLLCSIAVSALVLRTMLAFSHSEMPTSVSQRTLTFVERVAYQGAIEDIYWRHGLGRVLIPNRRLCGDVSGAIGKESRRLSGKIRGVGESVATTDHGGAITG